MSGDLQSRVGAKIGPRIAMLVSQAIVHTFTKLHHVKHRLAMAVFHSISDMISDEVDTTLGPIIDKLHAETPVDHPVYPALDFMKNATGQLKALAGTGLQISGLFGAISAIMNNELAPIVYANVFSNPHTLPDPQTILQLMSSGVVDREQGSAAIQSQGIPAGWVNDMFTISRTYPSIAEGLEMMRRGLATRDQVAEWAGLNGIPEPIVGLFLQLQNSPVSEADAALAVLRGNITQAEGVKIAADNGMDERSFNILIGNTGEPPGVMQLLEAYRRGFIDQAELEKGILQSRYRNEWIPTLEKLRYQPMSVSDAARAVVQNQMGIDKAKSYADQNGLQPGDFEIIVATEGDPLSRTEMEQLYNRGLASKDQVDQALRESRLKNKYNGLAFALHQRLVPEGTIARAMRYGEVDHATAVAKIMELGYSKDDATMIAASASGERLQTFKDRVVASVATMYEDSVLSLQDATSVIGSLGYTTQEVSFITQATELHREAHVINTVVTGIKTKYLSRHISKNNASGLLDAIGIPAGNRDQLLHVWEIEQSAYTRILTPAQIVKAVKLDLITADQANARLVGLGYAADDAALLIAGA